MTIDYDRSGAPGPTASLSTAVWRQAQTRAEFRRSAACVDPNSAVDKPTRSEPDEGPDGCSIDAAPSATNCRIAVPRRRSAAPGGWELEAQGQRFAHRPKRRRNLNLRSGSVRCELEAEQFPRTLLEVPSENVALRPRAHKSRTTRGIETTSAF